MDHTYYVDFLIDMDPHGGMQIPIQEVKSRNKPNPNVNTGGRAKERRFFNPQRK